MSLTVHHLNESRSQRVLFLLEELEIPYDIKFYRRDAKTMLAPPELKAVHPLGKSPVVTDGSDTLAETGLIIDTLIDRYGTGTTLRPQAGSPDRLRYGYHLHYAEGSLMPVVLMSLLLSGIATRSPRLLRPLGRLMTGGVMDTYVNPSIETQLDFLEAELAVRPGSPVST